MGGQIEEVKSRREQSLRIFSFCNKRKREKSLSDFLLFFFLINKSHYESFAINSLCLLLIKYSALIFPIIRFFSLFFHFWYIFFFIFLNLPSFLLFFFFNCPLINSFVFFSKITFFPLKNPPTILVVLPFFLLDLF